jgi:hypothetical protein
MYSKTNIKRTPQHDPHTTSKQMEQTHSHTNTYHGTHSMFAMPVKASVGTEVIPLLDRTRLPPAVFSFVPPCVGQEPDRTSGAPA